MANAPKKHSVTLNGHRTSISLEDDFWPALNQSATQKNMSLGKLIEQIDADRGDTGLSSAIRSYILQELQLKLAEVKRK